MSVLLLFFAVLSVTNIQAGTTLTLPSSAALASRDWNDASDRATIRTKDNNSNNITVALVLFKNIKNIFRDPRLVLLAITR